MRTLFLLLAACTLFAFTGCRCPKALARGETVHDTVSRTVHIMERDTVIVAPAAQAVATVPVKDLLNGEKVAVKSRDKQATVTLRTSADGKRIEAECDCDTLAIAARLRDRYEQESRATVITKTVTLREAFTPWYTKGLAWLGGIVLLSASLFLLGRYLFRLRKLV